MSCKTNDMHMCMHNERHAHVHVHAHVVHSAQCTTRAVACCRTSPIDLSCVEVTRGARFPPHSHLRTGGAQRMTSCKISRVNIVTDTICARPQATDMQAVCLRHRARQRRGLTPGHPSLQMSTTTLTHLFIQLFTHHNDPPCPHSP